MSYLKSHELQVLEIHVCSELEKSLTVNGSSFKGTDELKRKRNPLGARKRREGGTGEGRKEKRDRKRKKRNS